MTIGSILGETWSLYTKFFARFVLLALVVYLVVDFLAALLELAVGRDSTGASLLLAVVTAAVSVVGSFWLQGALVFAVQDVRDGSFDQSNKTIFDRVRPFLGTLIVAGILAGIGIAVGLVLLIVPGLVLLTWWALIGPAVVLEGKPVGAAFSRSRELVRGHGWTVFGVVLITGLLTSIAGGILSAVLSFLPQFLETWLGSAVAGALLAPFMALAVTLMYFELAGPTAAVAAASPPAA